MKRKLLTFITAAVTLAAVIGLTSCSDKTKFDELDEDGCTVSVTFDAGGGTIKGSDSTVIDVFDPAGYDKDGDGTAEISLLPPDSSLRDKNNILTISKPEHFLAGWYTERTPIDENDLTKGYTYSGKWNFDTDTVKVDMSKDYTSAESVITLYAAWIPYYNYEIYAKVDGAYQLINTQKAISLNIPAWTDNSVTIEMGNFPKRDGFTLDTVYSDEACTTPLAGTVTGSWDEATGTVTTPTVKLYTTWLEGDRYRIYSADDLRKNANRDGWYDIYADLDFSKVSWPGVFTTGAFNGVINGNGHTISGISVTSDSTKQYYGVFNSISDSAVISNVTFTGITHTFNTGRVVAGAVIGLLAGDIADGAAVSNVSVSGKLIFGDRCNGLKNADFRIGLLSASENDFGVDTGSIICEKENPSNTKFSVEITDGEVKLIFTE